MQYTQSTQMRWKELFNFSTPCGWKNKKICEKVVKSQNWVNCLYGILHQTRLVQVTIISSSTLSSVTSSDFTYPAIFNPSHMLSWCLVYVWLPFPFQRCSSGSRLYHGHCAHNCLSVRIQLSLVFWLVDIIANCSGKLHSSCQRITGPLLMTKCWMWKTLGIALGAPTIQEIP